MSYTADEIASAFLENYFTAQIKDPRLLADFYSHDSNFSWLHPGRPDQPLACGQQAILEKILSLQLEGSDVGVEQINAQSSGEGVHSLPPKRTPRPLSLACRPRPRLARANSTHAGPEGHGVATLCAPRPSRTRPLRCRHAHRPPRMRRACS